MKLITIAVFILLVCTPLYASESSHYAAASQLSNVLKGEAVKNQIIFGAESGIAEEKVRCSQNSETKPYCDLLADISRESLDEVFIRGAFFEEFTKKFKRIITLFYMDYFTENEIYDALKFYSTKCGQKSLYLLANPKSMEPLELEVKRAVEDIVQSNNNLIKNQFEERRQSKFQYLQKQGKLPKDMILK